MKAFNKKKNNGVKTRTDYIKQIGIVTECLYYLTVPKEYYKIHRNENSKILVVDLKFLDKDERDKRIKYFKNYTDITYIEFINHKDNVIHREFIQWVDKDRNGEENLLQVTNYMECCDTLVFGFIEDPRIDAEYGDWGEIERLTIPREYEYLKNNLKYKDFVIEVK